MPTLAHVDYDTVLNIIQIVMFYLPLLKIFCGSETFPVFFVVTMNVFLEDIRINKIEILLYMNDYTNKLYILNVRIIY